MADTTTKTLLTQEEFENFIKLYDEYRTLNKLGQADGIATLNSSGKLPLDFLTYIKSTDSVYGSTASDESKASELASDILAESDDKTFVTALKVYELYKELRTEATSEKAGMLSAELFNILSTVEQDAQKNVQSDWNVTDTTSDAYIANKPSLAKVATSGSFSDLSNRPTKSLTITTPTDSVTFNGFTERSIEFSLASDDDITGLFD